MSESSSCYRTTPVFDETSLPRALRSEHSTKAGAWGIIRILEGKLRYVVPETGEDVVLTPERPGLVRPQQLHFVEPLGAMRMQVEFHDRCPDL